jgi:hypothetical protein
VRSAPSSLPLTHRAKSLASATIIKGLVGFSMIGVASPSSRLPALQNSLLSLQP